MSKPLTMTKVLEDLQAVLHDLHDLAWTNGQPFVGLNIVGLQMQYRDVGLSAWDIRIVPATGVGDTEVSIPEQAGSEEDPAEAPPTS